MRRNTTRTLTGEGGINTLIGMNNTGINYSVDFDLRKLRFKELMRDLDIQLCCSRFQWKGLPPYLDSNLIELMLMYRGSLVAFKNGGILKILPYFQEGDLNIYGRLTKLTPMSFNGSEEGKKLKYRIDINGKLYDENENKNVGVVLNDKIPYYVSGIVPSRFYLDEVLNEVIADTLSRIQNNILNSENKVVFYCESENQRRVFENAIRNAYGSGNNFIVVVKGSNSIKETNPFHYKVENETQKLFESFQSYMNIKCLCMGIKNGGAFEKKERKIVGELNDDSIQSNMILEQGLIMRKLFLKQLKETFKGFKDIENIEVEKLEDTLMPKIEETNNPNESTSMKQEGDKNE